MIGTTPLLSLDLIFTVLPILFFQISAASAHQPRLIKRQLSSTTSLPAQIRTLIPLPHGSSSSPSGEVQTNIPVSTATSPSNDDKTVPIVISVVLVVLVLLLLAVIGTLVWRWRRRKQAKVTVKNNIVRLEDRGSSSSVAKSSLQDVLETPVDGK